jgi:5-hydroxyisourate hydrolase-like protein (transthyretin family)
MRYFVVILLIPLALSAQGAQAGGKNPPGGRGMTAALPPPPPTPTADLATLEGQVLNALGGTPLRKATITMNRQNSGPMAPGSRSNYSATSDISGRFIITGIEPGTYRLSAGHTGFLDMAYNARRPGGNNGTALDLGRAQRMTNVVFKLTPHGVVSGKITDEDGDPLQGVQVQIMRLVYNQGKKQLQQTSNTATNDLGEYRIAGVIPGKYFLSAAYRRPSVVLYGMDGVAGVADPPVQEDYVMTFFPGATDISAAAPIEMGPGDQVQGINIRLTKIHTVQVKGRVVNNTQTAPPLSAGRNVINMVVQVHLQPRSALNPTGMNPNTLVKPDGTFEFPSVPPGAYNLVAVTNQGNKSHAIRQALDVGNSNIEGIGLTINPGAMVSGHVRFDGDAPQPLPTLTVRLTPRDSMPGVSAPPPARVDADGSFRLDDVNPDHYDVTINQPPGFYLKSMRSGSTDAMIYGLDLGNGAGSLDILLGTNPPQVSGSVLNSATQQPAPAVTVVLIPQEKERQGQGFFYSSTSSDQYGNFSFNRVIPGEYRIYAWEDVQTGLWYDPEFMKTYEGKGESASAKEGSPVNVKLTMIPAK